MKQDLRDHFIPHEGNGYSPHVLQKAAMVAMVLLVVLSFTAVNLQALIWISSDWLVSTILPAVIVNETNRERNEDALLPLMRNTLLDEAAQQKAEHMAANQYFAHYSPDGVSPWYWFKAVDYNFVHAGENLAIHFTDSSQVVAAWMDSPTHRDNILNGNFQEIGIGVAEGQFEGFKTLYVVQLFGTPAEAAESAAVAAGPVSEPGGAAASEADSAPSTESVVTTPQLAVAGAQDQVMESEVEDQTESKPVSTATTTLTQTDVTESTTTQSSDIPSESGVVVYSGFISTSTGGTPATVAPDSATGDTKKPLFGFVTQPQLILQLLYATIGIFVVGALLLSILIEIRRQQPVQIAYGVLLLLLMYGLYTLHMGLTSGAVVV